MDKTTTNQVRQILMNELGLTRESVREMVSDIVESVIEKQMKRLDDTGYIDKLICKHLTSKYKSPEGRGFKHQVRYEITNNVVSLVRDNLLVDLKIDPEESIWSKSLPTEEGDYWWKESIDDINPILHGVYRSHGSLCVRATDGQGSTRISTLKGYWKKDEPPK